MTARMRLLIANRGEIARRVIRTARRLGHSTVAVYADPDAHAPFVREADVAVRIGPAALAESYLSVDAILDAARRTGATAVHPGYGFLSENARFAAAVIDASLTWVGPSPAAIESMGSKINARRLAVAAGVPVIPGFDASQDPADLAAAAERIGYPVLVKAAAGGGGKGIRIVHSADGFAAALAEATSEAARSFGDPSMIVERYITRPRHIEVQVVGDRHGNVVDLGTRECSVQRRYQKVLEEAPAPNLPEATTAGLRASAVALARSIGYDSAGTVEFVVDAGTGEHFFLEMNTRLQVEHPVTELTTAFDLVALQLRVAAGEALGFDQASVRFYGHAFEARINAEDATAGFVPQTGTVTHLRVPPGATHRDSTMRWDSAVDRGSEITPYYDPMVAKLIVAAPDREVARRLLADALDELVVGGVVTNTGFHRWLVEQPPIVDATVTTRFLDEAELPGPDPSAVAEAAAIAARAWAVAQSAVAEPGPWTAMGPFRVTPHRSPRRLALVDLHGAVHEADVPHGDDAALMGGTLVVHDDGVRRTFPVDVDRDGRSVAVNVGGTTHTFAVRTRSEQWAPSRAGGHGAASDVVAPFPAVVVEVPVEPGQAVGAGDVVVVVEAMKMLHSLRAPGPGVVAEVRVAPGASVKANEALVTFEEHAHGVGAAPIPPSAGASA